MLALADKLDTLVGIFSIGQKPSGVKDPYALRRASLGVLRILIETPLPLDLKPILAMAARQLAGKVDAASAANEVLEYSLERLKGYYQDRGIPADSVEAVLATGGNHAERYRPSHPGGRGLPAPARGRGPGSSQQAHPEHL